MNNEQDGPVTEPGENSTELNGGNGSPDRKPGTSEVSAFKRVAAICCALLFLVAGAVLLPTFLGGKQADINNKARSSSSASVSEGVSGASDGQSGSAAQESSPEQKTDAQTADGQLGKGFKLAVASTAVTMDTVSEAFSGTDTVKIIKLGEKAEVNVLPTYRKVAFKIAVNANTALSISADKGRIYAYDDGAENDRERAETITATDTALIDYLLWAATSDDGTELSNGVLTFSCGEYEYKLALTEVRSGAFELLLTEA